MKSKYAAIRKENKLRYGTDIGRIGTMLLADRYADRTHFIYESAVSPTAPRMSLQ